MLLKVLLKITLPDALYSALSYLQVWSHLPSLNRPLILTNIPTLTGSDTTSSALSKTLHLLSRHPETQKRLREEVTEARQMFGDLTYDQLVNLPYLDAVCRETLRV